MSLWAEPGGGGRLFIPEGAEDRAAKGQQGWGRGCQGERVTLREEMSLVFPTPHSEDAMDLVWVGRVEEDRLPLALRESQGHRVGKISKSSCVRPW